MEGLTEIRVEYKYYTKSRVTPIFIPNEDLLSLSYDGFYELVLNEVSHLRKISSESATAFRMTIIDEGSSGSDVDISTKYFSSQMVSLLDKGVKVIVVRATVADSPVAVTKTAGTKRKRLDLRNNNNNNANVAIDICNVSTPVQMYAAESPKRSNESPPVLLPLERYSKRHEEVLRNYSDELKLKTDELEHFDAKLKKACEQNNGHLNVCGNCHLKLGHTRKACTFSPCRSTFSCGVITKHNDQKSKRAAISKQISQLETKITKVNKDVESATTVVEKVRNSSQKI